MIAKLIVTGLLTVALIGDVYYTFKHMVRESYTCFSDTELAMRYFIATLLDMVLLMLVVWGW